MTHKEGIHADIKRAVLHNAVKYGGKADFKAVLGTILQLHPEKKAELASLRDEVEAAVAEINAWPPERQEERLRDLPPIVFEVSLTTPGTDEIAINI